MGKVFNAAGGTIGHYDVQLPSNIKDVQIVLKEGYTNHYFLDEEFDKSSVSVNITYSDGSTFEDYQSYIYRPRGPLTPDIKEIQFRIVDGGKVIERHFPIVVEDYNTVPVPQPGPNLVFNGNIQFPNWNFDNNLVELVTDGVDGSSGKSSAGTYQAKFRLKKPNSYRWDVPTENGPDDYKSDKIVPWVIEKKPEKIRVIPNRSNKEYTGEYTHILRWGDDNIIFQFIYPNANLSNDIDRNAVFIQKINFHSAIGSQASNNTLIFSFNGDGTGTFPQDITPGYISSIEISVNDSYFPNYKIDPIKINFNLQDRWSWGKEETVADEIWFEGLALEIAKNQDMSYLSNYRGKSKKIAFKQHLFETDLINIQCVYSDMYSLYFTTKETFNQPLKPEYYQNPTVDEYLNKATSTFEQYNKSFEQNFVGKKYMGTFTYYYTPPGFDADRIIVSDRKVVIPSATELGLIAPPDDLNPVEPKPEDPSNRDYNGIVKNSIFLTDNDRKKSMANSPDTFVKYWTRSTMVKCLPSDYLGDNYGETEVPVDTSYQTYKRHYIAVNNDGTAKLINSQTSEANDVYYVPLFRIAAFKDE